MKSPGAPAHRREVEREFWRELAQGSAGRGGRACCRRVAGGRLPVVPPRVAGCHLWIWLRVSGRYSVVRRARGDRAPTGSGSRGAGDRAAARSGAVDDLAGAAPQRGDAGGQARVPGIGCAVEGRASRSGPRRRSWSRTTRLREYVQERLSGHGPRFRTARSRARRGRRGTAATSRIAATGGWVQGWSPEQIASRLQVDFPDDESMRISHEAIYQALYVESRGALKRELVACLRTGRALRVPRARSARRPGRTSRPR